MLARLEAAFARERAFVADASHELRTPLAILKGELELALRDGRTAAELEAALRSAAEETDRLVQLAEDLLVIARSDQGRLPIRRTEARRRRRARAVRRRFASAPATAASSWPWAPQEGLRLTADPLRLEQALGNLVDNALRHGGERDRARAPSRRRAGRAPRARRRPGFPDGVPRRGPSTRFTRADPGARARRRRARAGDRRRDRQGARRRRRRRQRPGGGADVWIELPGAVAAPGTVPQLT